MEEQNEWLSLRDYESLYGVQALQKLKYKYSESYVDNETRKKMKQRLAKVLGNEHIYYVKEVDLTDEQKAVYSKICLHAFTNFANYWQSQYSGYFPSIELQIHRYDLDGKQLRTPETRIIDVEIPYSNAIDVKTNTFRVRVNYFTMAKEMNYVVDGLQEFGKTVSSTTTTNDVYNWLRNRIMDAQNV